MHTIHILNSIKSKCHLDMHNCLVLRNKSKTAKHIFYTEHTRLQLTFLLFRKLLRMEGLSCPEVDLPLPD